MRYPVDAHLARVTLLVAAPSTMLIRGRSHTKRVDVDVPLVPGLNASKRYGEAGGQKAVNRAHSRHCAPG